MRAVRAAAARGEADDTMGLGGSSKYHDAKERPRGSSLGHSHVRSSTKSSAQRTASRSRLLLSLKKLDRSVPRRCTQIKQDNVPKGSATKRSRAVGRVTSTCGPTRNHLDADSRFPMPYPGADRDPRQSRPLPAAGRQKDNQYHIIGGNASGEREQLKRAGAPRSESRRPQLNMRSSHGPAVAPSTRRTRPRSAVVVPLSRTSSGLSRGNRQSKIPVAHLKRKEISKAVLMEERGRGSGSKRPRPASAPLSRDAHHHHEKRGNNKGEGEMLLALSHVAGDSSSAPVELRIMKWVVLRETYLTKLRGVVSADRRRAKSAATTARKGRAFNIEINDKRRSPKLFALLTELLTVLRRITVEIVEAVERWRGEDKRRPFIWGSSNYLVKAACDIEFLARLPGLEEYLGVVVSENPFLSHRGLDGRSTVVDRSSIRSRSGKFPLSAPGSLGVSAERIAAATAVLYREVRRAGRRRVVRTKEEGVRTPWEDSPQLVPSPSRRKRSPPGPSEMRRQMEPRSGGCSAANGRIKNGRKSERQRWPEHSSNGRAVDDTRGASTCPGGDRSFHHLDMTRYRDSHHRNDHVMYEDGGGEGRKTINHLDGDGRHATQPVTHKIFTGPALTETGKIGHTGEERPSLYDGATGNDPQTYEERDTGSQFIRRKSSSRFDATEVERDSRDNQQGPRPSQSYNSEIPKYGSCGGRLPREGADHDADAANDHPLQATEIWCARNNSGDGGGNRESQYNRQRSSGSDYPRHGSPTPIMPFYAVAEHGDEDLRSLPPDDQSLDYQNGGVPYHDHYPEQHYPEQHYPEQHYSEQQYFEQDPEQQYPEQEGTEGGYHDDHQDLNYGYAEVGYAVYSEDQNGEGHNVDEAITRNEQHQGTNDLNVCQEGDPGTHEPDDRIHFIPEAPLATAPEDNGNGENTVSLQPPGDLVGFRPDSAIIEPHHEQSEFDAAAPVEMQPTEALPAVAEDTKSSGGHNPQDGNHGRMGRRGSPFNLIFNMCDGMLVDLQALGGRSKVREDDGVQPDSITYVDQATTHEWGGGARQQGCHEEEEDEPCTSPAQANISQSTVQEEVEEGGRGGTTPPALRGAVYASLTRHIAMVKKEGNAKDRKHSSGTNADKMRIMTHFFSAWAERTQGRLCHREAKAAKHYRQGRLRYAMAAWEAHRASFLGRRMAEAFAGSFGLTSRFFVKFAFDALRAHARGARLGARNRLAIEKIVSHMERFGRARLQQAWRRWAIQKVGSENWGEEHDEALEKLCRHWGRERLRGALYTWQCQPESNSGSVRPLIHAVGSFAALKGKLRTVGSFVNPNVSKSPHLARAGIPRENSIRTIETNSKEEDSWEKWLDNEGSISVVSPDGQKASIPAVASEMEVPLGSPTSRKAAAGGGTLSSRSFRGLGSKIKSMKSFRDPRDKSQTQRQRLRPTSSFGSPRGESSPSPVLPSNPTTSTVGMKAIDSRQVNHFAANRTKLRDEAVKFRSRQNAAAKIQRALWTAPRERRVASRVSNSASLIQRLWRLRIRRVRAGFLLVRAWRRRVRARVATLNSALIEAAGEGDLRAVRFLLHPAAAVGMALGSGLDGNVWLRGADPNATVGTERLTALHAAAGEKVRGVRGKNDGKIEDHVPKNTTEHQDKDTAGNVTRTTPTVPNKSIPINPDGLMGEERPRSRSSNWLKRKGDSVNWVGVIQALVESGAMIEARDGRGFTPMMTAAEEGSGETVAALAALGAEVDAKELRGGRRTPLVLAAQKANDSAAAALLEYGARANFTIRDNLTPLHESVGAGSIAVAEMLVRAGANVNATNESVGMTPLHLAVANNQHAAARLLVHSGANVCLPDARGLTCLRLTVEMGDAPTVALLLSAEPPADLYVEDENGGTVLHAACRLGQTDIARLLLEHGADPHVRDARGRTPELVALDLGHADCAGLFYNLDIHSCVPKQSGMDDSSSSRESGSREGKGTRAEIPHERNGRLGGSTSESCRSALGDYDDGQGGEGSREREAGTRDCALQEREEAVRDRDERHSSSGTFRNDFAQAVTAARRACSESMQLKEQLEPRASGSSALGGGEVEAGQTRLNPSDSALFGGASEAGETREEHGEMLASEGCKEESNATGNVDAGRAGGAWEWSETDGWVPGKSNQSHFPAQTEANPPTALNENGRGEAAALVVRDDGNEGYRNKSGEDLEPHPHPSESYSGWQYPYDPAADGGAHASGSTTQPHGSFDSQEHGTKQYEYHYDERGDPSYDTNGGNNNSDPQDQQNLALLETTNGEWFDYGDELPPARSVVDGGGEDTNHEALEASVSVGLALPYAVEYQRQEGETSKKEDGSAGGWGGGDEPEENAVAGTNHDSNPCDQDREGAKMPENEAVPTLGNNHIGSGDDRSRVNPGWTKEVVVATAVNRWFSKLDASSGSVYYQNEQSGLTQWDLPEGDMVVEYAE